MSFSSLGRKKELVISALIGFAGNSIGGSIAHIAFAINNKVMKIINAKLMHNSHINFI